MGAQDISAGNAKGLAPSKRKEQQLFSRLIGAAPIFYKTAQNVGLVDDLNAAYGPELTAVILSLAMHWLQDRDNVAKRYPRFCVNYALPFSGRLNEAELSSIYSALGVDQISQSKLFKLRCARVKKDARINYDSTSIPTTASDVYYGEESMTKDKCFKAMMHLSLVFDQESGLPIMYRLYDGKTPDCSTLADLISRIEEFAGDRHDLSFVLDRGYESHYNWAQCADTDTKCLMAARSCENDFIDEALRRHYDYWDASSVMPGTKVHAHTVKKDVSSNGKTYTLWAHVYRDDGKSDCETAAFMKKLDDFEREWKNAKEERREELEASKMMRYYETPGNDGELKRCAATIDEHCKYFGFFCNITNYPCDAKEAYETYRKRDDIEKCFKAGKMGINMDVSRAHYQDTMNGRFVVAFVALIIMSELLRQLGQERVFDDGRKKSIPARLYSFGDVVEITRPISIHYAVSTNETWITGVKKETRRLCIACGTPDIYEDKPDYISNLMDLREM